MKADRSIALGDTQRKSADAQPVDRCREGIAACSTERECCYRYPSGQAETLDKAWFDLACEKFMARRS